MHVEDLIEENPEPAAFDTAALAHAIKAAFACEESCSACADACLGEDDPGAMVRCIRLDLVCADICGTVGRVLSRQGTPPAAVLPLLEACRTVCALCAEECSQHQDEHCRLCAEACNRCADACAALLGAQVR